MYMIYLVLVYMFEQQISYIIYIFFLKEIMTIFFSLLFHPSTFLRRNVGGPKTVIMPQSGKGNEPKARNRIQRGGVFLGWDNLKK